MPQNAEFGMDRTAFHGLGDPAVGRRRFLKLSAAALVSSTIVPERAAAAMPANLAFRIFRKGEEIGEHRVSFTMNGDRIISRVQVDIAVKVAFVTAFRFQQQGEDHWRNGMLVRSMVQTNDDGELSRLQVEEGRGQLHVEGPSGAITVPLGMMTDTCFWNANIHSLSQVITAGDGDLAPFRSILHGPETLDIGGRPVRVNHYEVTTSQGRGGDIWYDENGRWVTSIIRTRGEVLEYRPIV
ncbi:MAG: DUF6134 family protein [Geminicoccaceae bacterium]